MVWEPSDESSERCLELRPGLFCSAVYVTGLEGDVEDMRREIAKLSDRCVKREAEIQQLVSDLPAEGERTSQAILRQLELERAVKALLQVLPYGKSGARLHDAAGSFEVEVLSPSGDIVVRAETQPPAEGGQ